MDSSDSSYTNHCDSTNSYNYACAKDSGNTDKGVWYNFYAASAGTIKTNNDSAIATSDICPVNWHLPSGSSRVSGTDFNKLVGDTTPDWRSPTPGLVAFGAVSGGSYGNGTIGTDVLNGTWWSATPGSAVLRMRLSYDSRIDQYRGDGSTDRYVGLFVRCVMKPTMQDATAESLAEAMPNVGDSIILADARDGQDYTVAKLADGKYWMTKNLNIAGGTTLNCDTTDCDGSYTLPSNQGWTATGTLPASSTTGFSADNYAYVYNSGNTTGCGASGQNTPCFSYYSWDAATLGSGRSLDAENVDAPYSICPKGWRLPTSGQHDGTTALTNWKRGDFYRLATAYGASLGDAYTQETVTFYNNAGTNTIPNFLLSGVYYNGTFDHGGGDGCYWSSTSANSILSRNLNLGIKYVNSANNVSRRRGLSIRCLKNS